MTTTTSYYHHHQHSVRRLTRLALPHTHTDANARTHAHTHAHAHGRVGDGGGGDETKERRQLLVMNDDDDDDVARTFFLSRRLTRTHAQAHARMNTHTHTRAGAQTLTLARTHTCNRYYYGSPHRHQSLGPPRPARQRRARTRTDPPQSLRLVRQRRRRTTKDDGPRRVTATINEKTKIPVVVVYMDRRASPVASRAAAAVRGGALEPMPRPGTGHVTPRTIDAPCVPPVDGRTGRTGVGDPPWSVRRAYSRPSPESRRRRRRRRAVGGERNLISNFSTVKTYKNMFPCPALHGSRLRTRRGLRAAFLLLLAAVGPKRVYATTTRRWVFIFYIF